MEILPSAKLVDSAKTYSSSLVHFDVYVQYEDADGVMEAMQCFGGGKILFHVFVQFMYIECFQYC